MPGYVLVKKSQSAWDARDGLRMPTLAQAAQDGPWQLPARIRAEAAQQEARGHAMVGADISEAERKLDEARALLDSDDDTGGGLAGHYDQALLGVQTAICYQQADRPERALDLYRQWLTPEVFNRRDFGYFRALAGQAHAEAGEPDAAAVAGLESLAIAAATRSIRTVTELHRLRGALTAWSDRPVVREFSATVAG